MDLLLSHFVLTIVLYINFRGFTFHGVDEKLPAKQQNLRPSKICTYTVYI